MTLYARQTLNCLTTPLTRAVTLPALSALLLIAISIETTSSLVLAGLLATMLAAITAEKSSTELEKAILEAIGIFGNPPPITQILLAQASCTSDQRLS